MLDTLERDKLLSDERYAGTLTRTRAERFGDARVRFDLKSSGVKAETVDRAVASLEGHGARTRTRRVGAPLRRTSATPQERARQARFLQSRGFSTETIRKVLRGLPGETDRRAA